MPLGFCCPTTWMKQCYSEYRLALWWNWRLWWIIKRRDLFHEHSWSIVEPCLGSVYVIFSTSQVSNAQIFRYSTHGGRAFTYIHTRHACACARTPHTKCQTSAFIQSRVASPSSCPTPTQPSRPPSVLPLPHKQPHVAAPCGPPFLSIPIKNMQLMSYPCSRLLPGDSLLSH